MTYYRPKWFSIEELVSPIVFNAEPDKERLWQCLDPDLLAVLDRLHDKFGSITVNNWKWGGQRDICGLRHLRYDWDKCVKEKIQMKSGMHEFGKAADCIVKNHTAAEVRAYILSHPKDFPEIRGIELNVNWLHFDTRNRDKVITF